MFSISTMPIGAQGSILWEGRYRATPIDGERYVLACMKYIEFNPVRAGMVKRAACAATRHAA